MSEILVSKQTGNQYKILCKVGEGAYADVFKGENIKSKELVAIKKMKHMKKADAQMAKKEIELMKTLNHKNIVKFYDQFRQNGAWYIILQYCGKGDLDKYKQKVGKIPEYHCKVLVRGILEAIVQLHTERKEMNKKKIAHRDLKLPNILINDEYQLKLADFGFSKDFQDGWMRSFCGTPLTMAPEVLKRDQYNEKCDVWSLGVITYYLLSNKYPYFPTKSDGPGLEGITNCVLKKPLIFDKNVQISDIGKDFIIRCLQKQVEKRPFSYQLLEHPWFDLEGAAKYSRLREDIISQSFEQSPEKQAFSRYKKMLFGVVEQHIKKVFETMLLSVKKMKGNIQLLKKYYPRQEEIVEYYLLTSYKKLEELSKREIIIILQNRSIKVETAKINKFVEFQKVTQRFIDQSLDELNPKREQNINTQKELLKFLLNESELLMQSYNEQQISDKLRLLKDMAKTLIKDYENSIVNVKWGERQDLKRLGKHIIDFIIEEKDEEIVNLINEESNDDEDLESIWLMEHQIVQNTRQRKSNSFEIEIGKQVLYILNISSNFTAERSPHSDKFELDIECLKIC